MSNRGNEWLEFSAKVYDHVENYTVPQYGDSPNDQIENWTIDDCFVAVKKYISRYGKNSREGQEELDFVKMAHYICVALYKHQKTEIKKNEEWTLKLLPTETVLFTTDGFHVNIPAFKNVNTNTKKIIIEVINESE